MDIKEKADEVSQKIVELTGFGTVLHVNDIKPDIVAALEDIQRATRERDIAVIESVKIEKPKEYDENMLPALDLGVEIDLNSKR